MADPANFDITQWFITSGMAIGAGVATVVAQKAWQRPTANSQGGARAPRGNFGDLQALRDLAEQAKTIAPRLIAVVSIVETLAAAEVKTAANIDKLIHLVEDYIDDQKAQRQSDDAYERGRDDALAGRPATSRRRKPPGE